MLIPVERCWVCGGAALTRYHECRFDFREYVRQDPELHAYTDRSTWLVRCAGCGFGQPEALPTLPGFFDRMYDQRWSDEWIESEFAASYKDLIFRTLLRELGRRSHNRSRRLLDVGAHVGRFLQQAQRSGWDVEGIELNPRTAAFAAAHTGAVVHQVNAHTLAAQADVYDAITITDVLEHIPDPVALLASLCRMLAPGGCLAVKVPCGRSQWQKERLLSAVRRSRRVSLADNLVHVNHFTPRSLTLALERAGFSRPTVRAGAPELSSGRGARARLSNAFRRGVYAAASLPGGVHTVFALNLQAYAAKASR